MIQSDLFEFCSEAYVLPSALLLGCSLSLPAQMGMSKFRLEINRIFLPFIAAGSLSISLVGTGKAKPQLVSRLSLVSL